MKKIFLLLLVTLFINELRAQKLEVAALTGVGFNTVPQNSKDSILPGTTNAVYNYAVGLKFFTNIKDWQAGIGIDLQKISRKSSTTKYIFANPATPIYLFVNHTFAQSYKGHFYAGVDIGLMFANSSNYTSYSNNNITTADAVYFEPGHGFTAGIHVGGVLILGKHLDLCAELGGKYGKYRYDYTHVDKFSIKTTGDDHYSYTFPSLVIGLHLKLFTDRFSQWY